MSISSHENLHVDATIVSPQVSGVRRRAMREDLLVFALDTG